MTENDEIVYEFLNTTGRIAQRSMEKLMQHDHASWLAAMHVLNVGGLLTVKSTASLAGVRMLAIDLTAPNGTVLNLMTVEIDDCSPTLN